MPGENLKEIDKNKDATILGQEIKDFLDMKNKNFLPNEKNLQAIAKEIDNNMNHKSININYEIDDMSLYQAYTDIVNKIKQQKEITPSDVKLLKLWMYVKEGVKDISFVDEQDYTKNMTLMRKINSINILYKNSLYQKKQPSSIVSVQNTVKPKVNTLPKMKETGPAKGSITQIENWYKETFPNEYKKLQNETQEKSDFYERTHTFHRTNIMSPIHLVIQAGDQLNKMAGYRTSQEKITYQAQENRYMMLLQIISAYAEVQQKEIGNILKGANWNEDTYKKEADYYIMYANYCSENQQLLTDFETQKKGLEEYGKQIENLMKKYYKGNIKEKKSDEILVKNFNDELNKKYGTGENKIKLERASKKMDMDVSTLSGDKDEDIDFFLQYLQDVEGIKSKYGKENIDRYSKFNNEILPLYNKNKTKIQQFEKTQKHIDKLFGNNKFDLKRIDTFQKVAKKIQIPQNNIEIALGDYQDDKKPKAGLLENMVNSSPDFSMLYKAGWKNVDPSAKQRELDKRYDSQPTIIQYARTIGTAIANVGTSFIGGIGDMRVTAFSALPLGDSWQSSVKCAGYIRNKDIIDPYKIEQTSLEQGSIVEDGRFNADKLSLKFWEAFDGSKVSGSGVTWTSQGVSTIANMILLIYGGKSLGGRNIGFNIGKMSFQGTTGLINMGMLISVGPSFKKYSDAGFDPQMASMAAFLESGLVSCLELVNVGPYFTKNTLKKLFTKQSFIKVILKDLGGENIQELTQTGAEKFMEIVTNNLGGFVGSKGKIDVNFTVEEAMNTIILTSIATLLVSGPGNIKNVKNNNTSYAYYEKMKAKPEMAANFINFVTSQKGKNIELPGLEGPQIIDDALIAKISEFLKNTPGIDVKNITFTQTDIEENAKLNDPERITKATSLLGMKEMTDTQQKAVIEAHNQDGVSGNLNFSQIKARVDILQKAGFTSDQMRILIESGICGQAQTLVLDVNKDGKFDTSDIDKMIDVKQGINTLNKNYESYIEGKVTDEKKIFQQEKKVFVPMDSGEILQYAKDNYQEIIEKYKEKMGNVVNADDFRDFVGGKVGIEANKTQKAVDYLSDVYFEELLIQNKGKYNNTVKFLAGGAGSGKSSIDDLSPNNEYAVVVDGTFKTYKNAEAKIEKAKELGYDIRIEFVIRDLNECFINGVLKRTISQNERTLSEYGEEGLGRTVPIQIFESGHNGARQTIMDLYQKYGSDVVKFYGGGDVDLPLGNGIVNKMATSKGQPKYVYQYDFAYTENKIKNDVFDREKSILAIEDSCQNLSITEKQKDDLLGTYK